MNEIVPNCPPYPFKSLLPLSSEIAGLTLAAIDQDEALTFFRSHPSIFLQDIQAHFALTSEQIDIYANQLNWDRVSVNRTIVWNEELISRHSNRFNWNLLSTMAMLPWSPEFIYRYESRWNWSLLSRNLDLPWSIALIDRFRSSWNWGSLCHNRVLPWSPDMVGHYVNHWKWPSLSRSHCVPWNIDLVNQFIDYWSWDELSTNTSLLCSTEVIEEFLDRWNWSRMRVGLSKSEDLFDKYSPRFPWCPKPLVAPQEGYQYFLPNAFKYRLLENYGLNLEVVERIRCGTGGNLIDKYLNDSDAEMSPELFDQLSEFFFWPGVSQSTDAPWSIELLGKYIEKWDWNALSENTSIPWSPLLISVYAQHLNLDQLGSHLNIAKRLLTDEKIDQLLNELLRS